MTDNRIGDAPIEANHHRLINTIGGVLDEVFNGDLKGEDRDVGWVLMVFPLERFDGRCNYISNARRADIVKLLREQLARFEGQAEQKDTP